MASQADNKKKEEETLKVNITGKTHVKPNKKLGRREYQLVTFDLPYLAFYYNQKLLLYKGSADHGFEDIVGKLKDGLGVVLEDFHQLAGKLGKDEDGVFRVEYDDDMEGVEIVEATAEGISLDDLTVEEGTTSFKELIPYNGILNLEGLHRPLLAVQLTKLKDGVVMGCAFNHAILDGTSTWHFMSSWAEICNGATSISVSPFLQRTKARDTRVKLDVTLPPDPLDASSEADARPVPQLREKVFKFSEAAIDMIKSKVNANPPLDGSKPFSTFQSLAVHIWRHVTHARELKPEDYTVFTVFADCRKRVDPPMPESYFGNLIQAIFTATAVGLLTMNPPEFGAAVIQKAIEAHDAKAINERNKEWESAPKIFQFKDAGVNCVAVGSSPRFPVYDVDFGWGKPESVRSGCNNRFDGMVYLYQGKSGGRSIDVEISLEAGVMERLEKDKDFLLEV
ncbi:BAHD acyltransferase DCR [Ricinus communis]|uniref:Anthranilate N-benzoyltransferase protein, putative n=1 Tax=Ricinus communis TaxID=3988 RepID=B9RIV2_RICCO|nr:BAHD acyltransferase DCR [Ricinus communis]EEF49074.1 Anthranilate N-benzoyltransferase protein, putative [Ricinus communis]|eukprot:XP_002513671.1 BAHD acyltransferase DCR [Ricinus communis]